MVVILVVRLLQDGFGEASIGDELSQRSCQLPVGTAVRVVNRDCEGCQARRLAANKLQVQSPRPPGCSVQYEPFAIDYFDVMGPYQLSKSEADTNTKVYIFTLSCHSRKFVKCEAAHDKSGYSASQALFKMLSDEGPVPLLVVDQGLNVPEVMSVADEWNAIVVAAPP
ncbi:hypothetical protein FOL47_009926 [Perkinsus chesapeaki]|uniref:Integrase catalytic domain-containing protein n=1 Tax=Perkinsus chesapeaki TaxID=330153 RepID=A0A7J6L5P0_PERCH|nr:hypothetical protein FOL47_009926 [Perkinsus chesapeaki]